jgi:ferredoxin
MMRVRVDDDRCKGHGICCGLCPDVFELTDKGYAVTQASEVPEQYQELVRKAVDECPEHAISIVE